MKGCYTGMDIPISERNHKRIQRKMESGLYTSTDDVINTALALLERLDPDVEREWADMRESVREGLEESKAGLGIPAHKVFDELRRRNADLVHEKRPMM